MPGEPRPEAPERSSLAREAKLSPEQHPPEEAPRRRTGRRAPDGRELEGPRTVEHQRSAVRDGQRLAQGEDRCVAGGPDRDLSIGRQQRLGAVLDEHQPVPVGQRPKLARRTGEAREVRQHEAARPVPDAPFQVLEVDPPARPDVVERRMGAGGEQRVHLDALVVRGDQHLSAFEAQHPGREVERAPAEVGPRDRERREGVLGKWPVRCPELRPSERGLRGNVRPRLRHPPGRVHARRGRPALARRSVTPPAPRSLSSDRRAPRAAPSRASGHRGGAADQP